MTTGSRRSSNLFLFFLRVTPHLLSDFLIIDRLPLLESHVLSALIDKQV